MLVSHFLKEFKNSDLDRVGLYILASVNLSDNFQKKNYFRAGVAGSRLTIDQDRSVTASGADSKASTLLSRFAKYYGENIQDMKIISVLTLPNSVRNTPTGPVITRILEKQNAGLVQGTTPLYALKGMTMAVALEKIMHIALDDMPKVKRGRTALSEWFQTTQNDYKNAKNAMMSVGRGVFYDLTKFAKDAMPADLSGKGITLTGGDMMDTTTYKLRQSPRLLTHTEQDIVAEDGSIKLSTDAIEDIRNNTLRGQQILALITEKKQYNSIHHSNK